MAEAPREPGRVAPAPRHARWVRVTHWIATASFLVLAFSGFEILMVHPRLYWGKAGNDLTPALLELPISRNYRHGGWDPSIPFFESASGPVTASRTYDIFNQNGWGRSLHFLAAWLLVLPGAIYLLSGIVSGHFRANLWPRLRELAPGSLWRDFVGHVRSPMPAASGGSHYNLLQKCSYALVVFAALPLIVVTGLTMSPAMTAAFPFLLDLFGGYQSARTIHFFTTVALLLFVLLHVVMVIRSGFRSQLRAMTVGE